MSVFWCLYNVLVLYWNVLGFTLESFNCDKLPTTKEVLARFLHFYKAEEMDKGTSASNTTQELIVVWNNLEIPTKRKDKIKAQILKLHSRYQLALKGQNKTNAYSKNQRNDFCASFSKLFDIAHFNVSHLIDNERSKNILLYQRGILKKLVYPQNDKIKRIGKVSGPSGASRNAPVQRRTASAASTLTSISTTTIPSLSDSDFEIPQKKAKPSVIIPTTRPKELIDPNLAITLDRYRLSNAGSTKILAIAAHNLGHDPENIALSYSTINRKRQKARRQVANQIQESFVANGALTVHWDGKEMNDIMGINMVERLAIVTSGIYDVFLFTYNFMIHLFYTRLRHCKNFGSTEN